MKIHLIKSREVDAQLYTRIVDLLGAIPGPLVFNCDDSSLVDFNKEDLYFEFIPDSDRFEKAEEIKRSVVTSESRVFPMERKTASWDTLFTKCAKFRKKHHIPVDEFVIIVSDIPNDRNWFASLDPDMRYNGFVHSADWDYYIECNPAFPIAYEVLALVLQNYIFRDLDDLRRSVHRSSIGCISDMCSQKTEIILKLRTADICKSCMEKLKQRMSMPEIHHALALMESLRVKMLFTQNLRQDTPLSRLIIGPGKRIILPGFGNMEIKLRPLEKALYLLFLKYPKGIFMSSLSDHRQELVDIYSTISATGTIDEMTARISELTNVLSNSASEKISRIKRCFEEALGDELAKPYYIQGGNGEQKKIALDRALVELS